jgi:hypothetical protein
LCCCWEVVKRLSSLLLPPFFYAEKTTTTVDVVVVALIIFTTAAAAAADEKTFRLYFSFFQFSVTLDTHTQTRLYNSHYTTSPPISFSSLLSSIKSFWFPFLMANGKEPVMAGII